MSVHAPPGISLTSGGNQGRKQHGRAPVLGHFPCDAAPRHHVAPFTLQPALGIGPIFIPTQVEEVEQLVTGRQGLGAQFRSE